MSAHSEAIKVEIEMALKSLERQYGDEFVTKIRSILYANLDRDRIDSFIEGEINRVGEYVQRVVESYLSLSGTIKELQCERNSIGWGPLFLKMQTWAYYFFLKKNFYADDHTREIATECATDAVVNILDAHFPYDTGFEPWAYVIVQYACQKYISKGTKKSVIPQQNLVELSEALENKASPTLEDQEQHRDLYDRILKAVAQLSEVRKWVIELHYFEELEFKEIAELLKKTTGAIYNLHFNALADLRKILSNNRDINNE